MEPLTLKGLNACLGGTMETDMIFIAEEIYYVSFALKFLICQYTLHTKLCTHSSMYNSGNAKVNELLCTCWRKVNLAQPMKMDEDRYLEVNWSKISAAGQELWDTLMLERRQVYSSSTITLGEKEKGVIPRSGRFPPSV